MERQPGASEDDLLAAVRTAAGDNGIDLTLPGNTLNAWYIDTGGQRISANEVGTFGYVPLDQGAAGVEVTVHVEFSAFVAAVFGRERLSAEANGGAVALYPDQFLGQGIYANCSEPQGNCYNNALNLSGSDIHILTGIHSNSGLHLTGSSFDQQPPSAEWGEPGECFDGGTGVCPPGGYAQQVRPVAMPVLYRWDDFIPGGGWWNRMCQGDDGEQCHYVDDSIGPGDVISKGLWVVTGNINSPRYYDPAQVHYTFVTRGNVTFNGDMPSWQPFEGSDTEGGSKCFIFTLAYDSGGIDIQGRSLAWQGVIYAPYGLAKLSGSSDVVADGTLYAYRIDLSGSTIRFTHDAYWMPGLQPLVMLLW
jgi:hypothetical protein